jgi:hypothetical protein
VGDTPSGSESIAAGFFMCAHHGRTLIPAKLFPSLVKAIRIFPWQPGISVFFFLPFQSGQSGTCGWIRDNHAHAIKQDNMLMFFYSNMTKL